MRSHSYERKQIAPRTYGLTERQLEYVKLVAEGLTNQEIADRLTVSIETVKSHIKQIRWILQMENRVQLAVWYVRTFNETR